VGPCCTLRPSGRSAPLCFCGHRGERRQFQQEGRAACRFGKLQHAAIAFGEFARDDEAEAASAAPGSRLRAKQVGAHRVRQARAVVRHPHRRAGALDPRGHVGHPFALPCESNGIVHQVEQDAENVLRIGQYEGAAAGDTNFETLRAAADLRFARLF